MRLGAFLQELQGLHFQVPEDDAAVARGAQFAPRLAHVIEQGLELLQNALDHYTTAGPAEGQPAFDGTLDDIGRLISSEIAGQEIADVLFMARSELRGAQQDLVASIDHEDVLRVASSCDSGLRTLKRILISCESAIHEFEGSEPPVRQWSDLEVSLQTRRTYSELRRDVVRLGRPRDADLADRLATVHDRLDHLRQRELYPLLRFDDRLTMRELRRRISRWITSGAEDLVGGHRLWQDISGFAELLGGINHRQELRHHDRALLRRAYHQLFGRGAHPPQIPEDLLYQLEALRGLDDDLDELLARRERGELPRWQIVLARLLRRISSTAEALTGGGWSG